MGRSAAFVVVSRRGELTAFTYSAQNGEYTLRPQIAVMSWISALGPHAEPSFRRADRASSASNSVQGTNHLRHQEEYIKLCAN